MTELFWLLLIGAGVWQVYMATFRTDDYLKLKRDHDARVGRVARGALSGGFKLLGWWLKRR